MQTRLFNAGIIALVCASILLGTVVVAMFTALGSRHRSSEESVREDAVWAAYQLDREVKKLGLTVREFENDASDTRRADVALRYDILYSRTSVLTSDHYAKKFGSDAELLSLADDARQRILTLAPLIDSLATSGDAAKTVASLHVELALLTRVTERLLNVSNLAQSRIRVEDRAGLTAAYSELANAMTALIASLAMIVIYLGVQLYYIRMARRRFEKLSIDNADAAQRAEAGARAKSIFLATMSHEIRTPLNGIIGMVEVMRAYAMGPDQRQRLAVIGDCSDTLLALIDDILDFSKLESGVVDFEIAPCEFGDICCALTNVMGQRAREKGIELQIENPQALITTDATRLRQILFNLVSNAVKFTDTGWVKVVCSLGEHDQLRVDVEDTGIGIPAEARERLFQDFSQLDITINRRFGGTGLGLAICRRLVSALGGDIGCSPREDGGSRFWFTLPVGPVQASNGPTERQAAPLSERPFSGRVLVAEDNLVNFTVARELLERLGLEVEHAPDGQIAAHLVAATHYDLVLMDMQMPVMNGLEATRTIRRQCPRAVPIIGLTANAFSSDREDCLAAGMSDFVAKPINRAKMTAILAKWLPEAPIDSDHRAPDGLHGGTANAGLVDEAARDELRREIGDDLLEELTRDFWRDATRMTAQASKAYASGDNGAALRELHTLKGVAGTLGLVAIETAAGCAQGAVQEHRQPLDMAALQTVLLRTMLTLDPADGREAGGTAQKGSTPDLAQGSRGAA
jgi:signal transduction histidine kinase/CheY-like chemotaxis protein/HPt (histidine-containing phosphotransfer) domain-containing protein